MEKFAGGAIAVICGSMLVHGKKDLSKIKKAVNELYRLNAALRIRIVETDGEVSQTVCEYAEQDFNVLCFDNKAGLDTYADDYAKKPLDFYGNLCEINIVTLPAQYGLLIKLHHIIGDAWTLSLLGTQFIKLMNGEEVEAFSYADYVESENTYIQSKRYEKDKAFFLEQFKRCDEVTYLLGHTPTDQDFTYTTNTEILTRFFELWTAKEAYGKYIGEGLFSKVYGEDVTVNHINLKTYILSICVNSV